MRADQEKLLILTLTEVEMDKRIQSKCVQIER